ncbi:MAG: DUF1761 domain-containing protein [Variibacter sp.]|nr:DUF1761 domain-containing protein [Variibacter sp.]
MMFAGLNVLAIVLAAVAAWVFGAAYYMALARPWLASQGKNLEEARRNPEKTGVAAALPFIISFVAEILMAWVLAGAVGPLGPGQVTVRNGVISGVFLWGGFILTTLVVNNMFAMRKPMLSLIDAGHWLGVMVLMGAIIGFIGV